MPLRFPVSFLGSASALSPRDTNAPLPPTSSSSTLDARSLGIGIVIGMLSTLILTTLVFLLTHMRRTSRLRLFPSSPTTHTPSHAQSSARRHLIRSTNSRITIEDDLPPLSFHTETNLRVHPPNPLQSNNWDDDFVLDIAPVVKNEPKTPARPPSPPNPTYPRSARLPSDFWMNDPPRSANRPSFSDHGHAHTTTLPNSTGEAQSRAIHRSRSLQMTPSTSGSGSGPSTGGGSGSGSSRGPGSLAHHASTSQLDRNSSYTHSPRTPFPEDLKSPYSSTSQSQRTPESINATLLTTPTTPKRRRRKADSSLFPTNRPEHSLALQNMSSHIPEREERDSLSLPANQAPRELGQSPPPPYAGHLGSSDSE